MLIYINTTYHRKTGDRMKVLGIIAEYNPFHNGHLYHLKKAQALSDADYTICIMSGNFLQRGEPALYNKWIRSEAAIKNGVDVILELPTAFACSSAEFFSKAAISILNRLGCVTHLAFGSETDDIDLIYQTADLLANESDHYTQVLKNNLSKGLSFPHAREKSLKEIGCQNQGNILNQPNNILAIEYLKALIRLNSRIKPIAVKRIGASYHQTSIDEKISSATAIRNQLQKSNNNIKSLSHALPFYTYQIMQHCLSNSIKPVYLSDIFEVLQYRLFTSTPKDLRKIFSVVEGLENRILNEVRLVNNMDAFINHIKTKRYTQTGIQRLLIHTLLGLSKKHMNYFNTYPECFYGRILGLSSKGSHLIRTIKKKESHSIPLITNINKEVMPDSSVAKLLHYDIIASDIYHLISGNYDLYKASDYVKMPYIE